MSLFYNTVYGDFLSGPDQHNIADLYLFHRDILFTAIAHDPRGPGLKSDQLLYCLRSPSFCPCLKEPPEQNEHDDGRSRIKIYMRWISPYRKNGWKKRCRHAVDIRRARSDGDKGVHIRRSVPRRSQGAGIKLPSHPELYRSLDEELHKKVCLSRDFKKHGQAQSLPEDKKENRYSQYSAG